MARVNTGSTYRVALDTDYTFIYIDAENTGDLLQFLADNYINEHTICGIKYLGPIGTLSPESEIDRTIDMNKQSSSIQLNREVDMQIQIRAFGKSRITRENRQKYSVSMKPSLQQAAQQKAHQEGLSLSEVISYYLEEYVRER